jgi:hypothetical protein
MPADYTTTCGIALKDILGNDCIGDTKDVINNNIRALGTAVCSVSGLVYAPGSTDTIQQSIIGRIAYPSLKDDAVTTAKLSAQAVTTNKIALTAVTTDKIALSAVTADRINLVTSLSTNGYQIMPGGLIMQWGRLGPFTTQVSPSATFPIPFPTQCIHAQVTARLFTAGSLGPQGTFGQIVRFDTSRLQLQVQNAEIEPFDSTELFWSAIGH